MNTEDPNIDFDKEMLKLMNHLFPAPPDCVCTQAKYGFIGNDDKLCYNHHKFKDGKEYICTREKGHDGEHVACGLGEHRVASWPNDKQ